VPFFLSCTGIAFPGIRALLGQGMFGILGLVLVNIFGTSGV